MSQVTKKAKWMKKKPDLDKEELRVLKSMQKAFEEAKEREKDEIDYFGMLVIEELRKLSPINQRIARHQIENLLFNLQMNQEANPAHSYNPSAAFSPSASYIPTPWSTISHGPLGPHIPSEPTSPAFHPILNPIHSTSQNREER